MNSKAIYPGTFDPVTNGHVDMITRAANIVPELVVAVASNSTKRPFFSLNERIAFVQEAVKGLPGVSVVGFQQLLVHFVHEQGARVILRGLGGDVSGFVPESVVKAFKAPRPIA